METLAYLKGSYAAFVAENAAQIASIESALRSLSYFLPGRFKDAEFASEILFTGVNLLTLCNDAILAQKYGELPSVRILSPEVMRKLPSFATRSNIYARLSLRHASPAARRLTYALVLLRTVETVAEMSIMRVVGRRRRLKYILVIEAAKAACRLALLRLSNGRMGLAQALPDRPLPEEAALLQRLRQETNADEKRVAWMGARSGAVYPTSEQVQAAGKAGPVPTSPADLFNISALLGDGGARDAALEHVAQRALGPTARPPEDWVRPLTGVRLAGEIVGICQATLYVCALLRYGETSWKPWCFSLLLQLSSVSAVAVDFPACFETARAGLSGEWAAASSLAGKLGVRGVKAVARLLRRVLFRRAAARAATERPDEPPAEESLKAETLPKKTGSIFSTTLWRASLSPLERDECKRRLWLLLWLLLREPMYSYFTRARLDRFCDSARRKPILSLFASVIRDYQPLWEQVYFVTAAS